MNYPSSGQVTPHKIKKLPILYFLKGKLGKSVKKDEDMLFSRKVWTPHKKLSWKLKP